jgi:hypothetical protein
MADVFVSEIGVPKKARNGKIFSGNSFAVTNQFQTSSEGGGGQRHFETGRIVYETGDSRSITVPFTESFDNTPVLSEFKIYRMVFRYGYWSIHDVVHHFDSEAWYDLDEFSVIIDDTEDMEGVILNYNFTI